MFTKKVYQTTVSSKKNNDNNNKCLFGINLHMCVVSITTRGPEEAGRAQFNLETPTYATVAYSVR